MSSAACSCWGSRSTWCWAARSICPCPVGAPVAGVLSVYALGVFSGVASSCCAPVLAGVIALSGVASSFGLALGLGLAYVLGMVAPLFVISVLWERVDWRSSGLFRPRAVAWRLGSLQRTVAVMTLASALLLAIMGLAMAWIGLTGTAMPVDTGWQANLTVRLQHDGQMLMTALSGIPGWVSAAVLLAIVALLARRAVGQVGWTGARDEDVATDDAAAAGPSEVAIAVRSPELPCCAGPVTTKEEIGEYRQA